jgi:hypothetical protein
MIVEEIINNVLEDDNSENEQESNTPQIIRTIRHDDTMSAFNMCYNWAEKTTCKLKISSHCEDRKKKF